MANGVLKGLSNTKKRMIAHFMHVNAEESRLKLKKTAMACTSLGYGVSGESIKQTWRSEGFADEVKHLLARTPWNNIDDVTDIATEVGGAPGNPVVLDGVAADVTPSGSESAATSAHRAHQRAHMQKQTLQLGRFAAFLFVLVFLTSCFFQNCGFSWCTCRPAERAQPQECK